MRRTPQLHISERQPDLFISESSSNAYQVANDMLNFSGDDGAETSGLDLRAVPPMRLSFCSGPADIATKARFDKGMRQGSHGGCRIVALPSSNLGDQGGGCKMYVWC